MLTRRELLGLLLLLGLPRVADGDGRWRGRFEAEVTLLYGLIALRLVGTVTEEADREAGRYRVHAEGEGDGILHRAESTGVLQDGRWAPRRSEALTRVLGRESWVELLYDPGGGSVRYQGRSETFWLRRLRVVNDVVAVPEGTVVDDVGSAALNFAAGSWRPGPDGTLVTHVVRRRRRPREGPEDLEPSYRAELVPLVLRLQPGEAPGELAAEFDLSRFSSWAREDRPARITFGTDRHPRTLAASLLLGTALTIRVAGASRGQGPAASGAPAPAPAAGRRMVKVVPRPGSDSTSMVAP